MTLGPWEQAALDYEVKAFKEYDTSAIFLGGIVLGMAISLQHPEYARAAVPMSQQQYNKERPHDERLEVEVERFVRAVPIALHDESNNGQR